MTFASRRWGRHLDFYYHTVHHVISDSRVSSIVRGLDVGVGSTSVDISATRPSTDHVFALRGFELAFHGTDHHIDRVGVFHVGGTLRVVFADENSDDTFLWSLRYAWVPQDLFAALGTSIGSRAQGADSDSVTAGPFVIRGFHFNFGSYFTSGTDHHLRDIGVFSRDGGTVEAYYEDKNGDDGFDWFVF